MLARVVTLVACAGQAAGTALCSSSSDCGLNGECNARGRCLCDPGWTSTNCTVLDLLPARYEPERQAYETNFSSWGGNVLPAPDGTFHLFFSEMAAEGLHQFKDYSQASQAIGTSPLGPFTQRRVIRGPLSHNVQPQIGPDGAIYIFMIGLDGPNAGQPWRNGPIMVGRSEGFDGAWEWVVPDFYDTGGNQIIKDNPSAVMYSNGTVLLVTRGLSLFLATSWRGPYRMILDDVLPCGEFCKQEDPFLWQSPRGLHLLMHDHEPFDFHKQVLTYAFTEDVSGLTGWTFSWQIAASGTNVSFDDGSTHTFCSRQRPILYFSEPARDGIQHGLPLVLFTGVQRGALTEETALCGINNENRSEYNPYVDYSFTFAQPLAPAATLLADQDGPMIA